MCGILYRGFLPSTNYTSYSCFGDLGGGIFQNNSLNPVRTVLSGLITFGNTDVNASSAYNGLCYSVGGESGMLVTRVLHDFDQGDIIWILNTTELRNAP